jgi:hypothetical protein
MNPRAVLAVNTGVVKRLAPPRIRVGIEETSEKHWCLQLTPHSVREPA